MPDETVGLDPAIHRRRVSDRLRSLRSTRELTLQDVARKFDWSVSKLIRIEGGTVGISSTDLRALLSLYGVVDDEEVANLVVEARGGRQRAWSSKYRDLYPKTFLDYLGHESSARAVRQFQPLLVPGIFQSEEYAHAVISATPQPAERVDMLVAARLDRQRVVLDPERRREITAIIDEGVLRRVVGGPQVMSAQLRRLADIGRSGQADIRVLRFSAGAHPSMAGPFSLVELPDEVVVFSEGPRGDMLTRGDPEDSSRHEDKFDQLLELAASAATSIDLLDAIANGMRELPADELGDTNG